MTFLTLSLIGAGIIATLALILSHMHLIALLIWIIINTALLWSLNAGQLALIYLVLAQGMLLLGLFLQPLQPKVENGAQRKKDIFLRTLLFMLVLAGNLLAIIKLPNRNNSLDQLGHRIQTAPFFMITAGILLTFIVGITLIRRED